jgi:hypothetical protein
MAHRNRWFTVLKRWFSMAMLNIQMVIKKGSFFTISAKWCFTYVDHWFDDLPLFTKFFDCMAWHCQMIHSCATIWRTFRFSCIASTLHHPQSISMCLLQPEFSSLLASTVEYMWFLDRCGTPNKPTTELWRFGLLFRGAGNHAMRIDQAPDISTNFPKAHQVANPTCFCELSDNFFAED